MLYFKGQGSSRTALTPKQTQNREQVRKPFDGNLAENIRDVVLPDINTASESLERLLEFEHPAAVIRNLLGGHKELVKARASIGLAAVAAEQLEAGK